MKQKIKPEAYIAVLDLDDTLYAEYEYKLSGIQAVCQHIALLYPQYRADILLAKIDAGSSHWLEQLCTECSFNDSEKQSLLWLYRTHNPSLTPFMPAVELNNLLHPFAARILVTDGRSITQRLKLEALGLLDCFDEIMISEAWQSEKPDGKRFIQIEKTYPGKKYFYVGDNLKKDFITPKSMGWLTLGIRAKAHSIHQHLPQHFDVAHHPDIWLDNISELQTIINT